MTMSVSHKKRTKKTDLLLRCIGEMATKGTEGPTLEWKKQKDLDDSNSETLEYSRGRKRVPSTGGLPLRVGGAQSSCFSHRWEKGTDKRRMGQMRRSR